MRTKFDTIKGRKAGSIPAGTASRKTRFYSEFFFMTQVFEYRFSGGPLNRENGGDSRRTPGEPPFLPLIVMLRVRVAL